MVRPNNIDRYLLDQASSETDDVSKQDAYRKINEAFGYQGQTGGYSEALVALTNSRPADDPDSDDAWRQSAACLGVGPELFFPKTRGDTMKHGRAICATCEVTEPCLEEALLIGEELQGIRAGTDQRERRNIRRQRRLSDRAK